jgi:hypothetical protein
MKSFRRPIRDARNDDLVRAVHSHKYARITDISLQLQTSIGSTSSLTTSTDQRWSEVVPPDSSLTFAAVYDQEGLVLFCGGDVLPSTSTKTHSVDSPTDVLDCPGQVLSIEDYATSPSADNTAIRAFFCDKPPYSLGHTSPAFERFRQRESSTLDGVDLYSRDLQNPKTSRQWSVFSKLDKGPNFNAQTAFSNIPVPRNAQTERHFRDDSVYWGETHGRVPSSANGGLRVDHNLVCIYLHLCIVSADHCILGIQILFNDDLHLGLCRS